MRNKNKITYRFANDALNKRDIAEDLIKDILVKATPTSSCWWSKMKTTVNGLGSTFQELKKRQKDYILNRIEPQNSMETTATTKTCPGILGLFKQAYLVKSPSEILITTDANGDYYYDVSDPSAIAVSSHHENQFYQDDNTLFAGKIAIKFAIGVRLKTTGFGYMLADPMYHNKSEFSVPMGIISAKYSNVQELNIITFIDKPKEGELKTIHIKAGDVLAYLIPFEDCSLSFSEEDFIAKQIRKTFSSKGWFND